jgi:hypothetical protein
LTYLALQHTQPAFEHVHDGKVDALPVVDDLVVMNSGDDKCRRVVFASIFYALLLRFLGVPSLGFGSRLFGLSD